MERRLYSEEHELFRQSFRKFVEAEVEEAAQLRGRGPPRGAGETKVLPPGDWHLSQAHGALCLDRRRDRVVAPAHGAREDSRTADDCAKHGGLARPVRPREPQDLPAVQPKRDGADDRIAIAGHQVLDLQQQVAVHLALATAATQRSTCAR